MRIRAFAANAAVLALILSACGTNEDTSGSGAEERPAAEPGSGPKTTTGGTLTVVQVADMLSFDPTQFATVNHTFMLNIYDQLTRIGSDGLAQAHLAEDWSVSDDGLTITFTLRDGVTFHDGSPVDADAVVFSYEYTTDPENGTNLAGRMTAAVESIKAVDARTVQFTMKRVSPGFFDLVDVFHILNPNAIENIDETGAGSGPFIVSGRSPGESFSLERNPNYWRDGLPVLDKVIFRVISDSEAQFAAIVDGQADWIYQAAPRVADRAEREAGLRVVQEALGADNPYIAFNVTRPPFDDKRVRQAFAMMINRELLLAVTYPGGSGVVACQPFPTTSPWNVSGLDEGLETCQFNPQRAAELLAEAGYPDGIDKSMHEISINVSQTYGVAGTVDMAQIYQEDLASIGVNVGVLVLEGGEARKRLLSSDFDIVIHTYSASGADPGFNFPSRTWGPVDNSFPLVTATAFPEYAAVIQEAGGELNRDRRRELYADLSRIIADEAFINQVGYTYSINVVRDRVEGNVSTLTGWPDFANVSLSD